MHDLKYPDELFLKIHPQQVQPVIQASTGTIFYDAAVAFKDSMEQVRLLTMLPEYMVRATAGQIMFDVAALYEATGLPLPTREITPEEVKKIQEIKERKLREEEAVTDLELIERKLRKDIRDSTAMLRRLCSLKEGTNETLSAVECFLISLMLQIWTAFESFLTDVWIVALNYGPKSLSSHAARAKGSTEGKEQQGKSFGFESLERFNFDLTKSMGFLLKEKFDFTRLANIKNTYIATFGKQAEPLFDTANLNPANNAAHEAIRNVFAHRGGRVDSRFRYLISKCPASDFYSMRDLKDGEKVQMDGSMVRELWLSARVFRVSLR